MPGLSESELLRFYTIGSLSKNGFDCNCLYEKANTGTFFKPLKAPHCKYGRVLLFVDGASCHKSA